MPYPNPDPTYYDPWDDKLTTPSQDRMNYFENLERDKKQTRQDQLRQGAPKRPMEEYKEFGEQNPILNAVLGFIPGLGDAQGLADMALAKEDGGLAGELLANLAMIPGVRPTRRIIAALDDLGEGGIKVLIRDLEKAGLVDEKMIKQMFTENGDLRLFHGTSNMDLKELTHEGTLDAVDESTDMWAGPGTYFASNWDSPINIPESLDGNLRIVEQQIPRDQLDRYALTNFTDSDLVKMGDGRQYGYGDQTMRVQMGLDKMYPNMSQGDSMDAYDVSLMGTDVPNRSMADRGDDFEELANNPAVNDEPNAYEGRDVYQQLDTASEANKRALSHGIRGNVHSDSTGVSAAVFDPDEMSVGPTHSVTEREVRDARSRYLNKTRIGGTDLSDLAHPSGSKARSWDAENILKELRMKRLSPEHSASAQAAMAIRKQEFPSYNSWANQMKSQQSVEGQIRVIEQAAERYGKEMAYLLADEFNININALMIL